MFCRKHPGKNILGLCPSDYCQYLPLCQACTYEHHKQIHTSLPQLQIIPLKKAQIQAQSNLQRYTKQINNLLDPIVNRQQLYQKVKKQKQQLNMERQRLKLQIDRLIDQQIRQLQNNNNIFENQKQNNISEKLQQKLKQTQKLTPKNIQQNVNSLQKALCLSMKGFYNQMQKEGVDIESNIYIYNKYKFYPQVKHHIQINRLKLQQSNLTPTYKRTMNQSPLYFLIDHHSNQHNYVYSHSTQTTPLIYAYNILTEKTTSYHPSLSIPKHTAVAFDHITGTYILLGGQLNGRKSSRILMCTHDGKQLKFIQSQIRLITPRSHAQATYICDSTGQYGYVIIAGGLSENREILKNCEIINLTKRQTIQTSMTNFACFNGLLVAYSNRLVLRIGGQGQNKQKGSILQIIQKMQIDMQSLNQKWEEYGSKLRWSYAQLQVGQSIGRVMPQIFYARQMGKQINPNQILIFGGQDSNNRFTGTTYIIGVQQFEVTSRSVMSSQRQKIKKQYRFTSRWINQKRLISQQGLSEECPVLFKKGLYCFQNKGKKQKKMISFDMYQWTQTDDIIK